MDIAGGVHSVRQESPSGRVAFLEINQKWLHMLLMWARDRPVTDAMDEAEVQSRTAVDIYQWFREVCTTKLLQTSIVLGGPGVVVQIDESLFRHKPKVYIF